jgi:hypothetical protein
MHLQSPPVGPATDGPHVPTWQRCDGVLPSDESVGFQLGDRHGGRRGSAADPGSSTSGSISSLNSKQPRRHRSLLVHRNIPAVDIEGSTRRINPVKEELRADVYRLVVDALCVTGIDSQHYDPFTDRGDGLLQRLKGQRLSPSW